MGLVLIIPNLTEAEMLVADSVTDKANLGPNVRYFRVVQREEIYSLELKQANKGYFAPLVFDGKIYDGGDAAVAREIIDRFGGVIGYAVIAELTNEQLETLLLSEFEYSEVKVS